MGRSIEQLIAIGLSRNEAEQLITLDPSTTKKYIPFLVKSFRAGVNMDDLRNRITEYDTLVSRNIAIRKDISSFGSFKELSDYVVQLNNQKSRRELKRECKRNAEIILDNESLFIVSPHGHEASTLYGSGTRWCTTMTNGVHFDHYYFKHMVTFYYIQVRSESLKKSLGENLWKLAVVAYPNGRLDVYTAADRLLGSNRTDSRQKDALYSIFSRLGINEALFLPRYVDERLAEYITVRKDETELNMNRFGINKLPDNIGGLTALKTLILSENNITVVPDSIGQLSGLTTLYLFHNNISILPESFSNLKQLKWLGLTGNPLPRKKISELKLKLPQTRIYA